MVTAESPCSRQLQGWLDALGLCKLHRCLPPWRVCDCGLHLMHSQHGTSSSTSAKAGSLESKPPVVGRYLARRLSFCRQLAGVCPAEGEACQNRRVAVQLPSKELRQRPAWQPALMLPELGPKGKHLQLVACCADGSPGSHLFNRCYLLILLVGETLKLKCMENTHNGHRDKQADTFPVTY